MHSLKDQPDESEDMLILIVSNEEWGKQWFIKHHYANELSKMGREVYFLNPVGKWRISNLWDRELRLEKAQESLTLVNYKNFLPVSILQRFTTRINDYLISRAISLRLQRNRKMILWQFDPFRFVFSYFKKTANIYHVADDYRKMVFDKQIITKSDCVICTSKSFMEHYRSHKENVIHIPHGISSDEFEVDPKRVKLLQERYGKFVFHVGSMYDRLNFELLFRIAESLGDVSLVLAGPISIKKTENQRWFDKCISRDNVHYLGTIHASEIKHYVQASSVCIVIYNEGVATSALKILNYVAHRKPVISTLLIEEESLQEKAIYFADNTDLYLQRIQEALNGDLEVEDALIEKFLESRSYKNLIAKVLEISSSMD